MSDMRLYIIHQYGNNGLESTVAIRAIDDEDFDCLFPQYTKLGKGYTIIGQGNGGFVRRDFPLPSSASA